MSDAPAISIVSPAYNEANGLAAFHDRVTAVMAGLSLDYEIVFINDGSRDATLAVMRKLAAQDTHVSIVNLSRNFGKEIALTAGLDHARGDAVIVIDSDLQDPPEVIPQLIAKWREGFDMVYARRIRRDGETALKKTTAAAFYRLIHQVGPVQLPKDTGDFRLMTRRVADAVRSMREQHRFMKGLFAWVGYPTAEVTYARDPRFAGRTHMNYWNLWNLAVEGITSFTVFPLKVATYLGLFVALGAFVYGMGIILKTLIYGVDVPGYASLAVIVLFLGGLQLLALGIIGEYLGRIFNESKRRPLYWVADYEPARMDAPKP